MRRRPCSYNYYSFLWILGIIIVLSFGNTCCKCFRFQPQFAAVVTRRRLALHQTTSKNVHHDRCFQNRSVEQINAHLLILRGGSSSEGDLELPTDDDDGDNEVVSFGLGKIRNIVRSVLGMTKKSPVVHGALKSVIGIVEGILGIRLLPQKKAKKKRKQGSPKSKAVVKDDMKNSERKTSKKQSKPEKSQNAALKHVQTTVKSSSPNYRIQRELKEFLKEPPPNLSVKVGKNIRVWIVTMKGAPNTIYEGETFRLRISFPPQYPTVPPSVYFLPPHIPIHEHVYTNGDICLSLLGKDWRPTMTAQSIAVSILSILSSAQSKSLPMDNARHAQNKPGEYQKDWVYHDDNC